MMTRRSFLLGTGTLLLLTGTIGGTLLGLILREPSFYSRVEISPGPEREQLSRDFQTEFLGFLENARDPRKRDEWGATFTQGQINSFLLEDFIHSNTDKQILPENVSAPRIAFEEETIRLAFRYHVGRWSTIVSIDMRVWLAGAEPNVIALELQSMRAGSLPVSARSLRGRLTEAADRNNIKVTWYRHNGNPVALLRFSSEQPRTTLLKNIDLYPGMLSVRGQSAAADEPTGEPAPEG